MVCDQITSKADIEWQIRARPNCALSTTQLRGAMAFIAGCCFLMPMVMWLQGFWLALPFAGLETVWVCVALWLSHRRMRREEHFRLRDGRLEYRETCTRRRLEHSWLAPWVQISLDSGRTRNAPSRLRLGSHGRWVDVASLLTNEERRELAQLLRERLAPLSALQ